MTPCRPGTAAVAAVVIGVAIGLALRGVARTRAEGAEAGGPWLGPRVRAWYRGLMEPLENVCVAGGIRPDTLTYAQLVVSVLAGIAFATRAIFLAGWLVILAGTLDILDGGVARRGGLASTRGALVDSLVDRYSEFATFVGLGVLFRDSWLLGVVAVACFASLMVSYTRARAEGLGLRLQLGSAQRPERYVLLGFGAWGSALGAHLACPWAGRPSHVVLPAALVLLAAISAWTAVQRGTHAARALATRSAP